MAPQTERPKHFVALGVFYFSQGAAVSLSPRILIKAARGDMKPDHKWLTRERNPVTGEWKYKYHRAASKRAKAAPPGPADSAQAAAEPPQLRISKKANDDALRSLRVRPFHSYARMPAKFRDYDEQEREKTKSHIASRLARRMQRDDPPWHNNPHSRADANDLARSFLEDPRLHMDDQEAFDWDAVEAAPVQLTTRLLVSSWAQTAADHDAMAVALQAAAREAFELDECAMDHLPLHAGADSLREDVQYILDNHRPLLHAFLRAQYVETQEHFSQMGIKEVTLYRGFKFDRMDDHLPDFVKHIDDDGVTMPVQLQPMSSFGAEYDSCKFFAAGGHDTVFSDRYAGFMMGVTIPVEKVIGTCRTGFGCLVESEMVVLGGVYDSFVSKIDRAGVTAWGSDGNVQVQESEFIQRAKQAKVWSK